MNNFKYRFQNMMYNSATKMQRFMYGRYGIDDLYRFMTYVIIINCVLQIFTRSRFLYYFNFILIIYSTFRAFSKNHSKRYKENQLFLKIFTPIKNYFKLLKRMYKERENYRFRTCPNCKKVLRLPNKKGKHTVSCPNCHKEFDVKI